MLTASGVPALDMKAVSKTFGASTVLDAVSLQVGPGEVRALVGENGSGKSTLIKVLAGYHAPDTGAEISVGGRAVPLHSPAASDAAGLRFVHQDLGLVGSMTAYENLRLGVGYARRAWTAVPWGRRRREAAEALQELGYTIDVEMPVARLTASERTAIAVARAVTGEGPEPHVLVLDEPTANLPGSEIERLFDLVRAVRDRGIAVVLVSHNLGEVFELADTVTVLRNGRHVTTCDVAELDHDSLVEAMIGRPLDQLATTTQPPRLPPVLEVLGLADGTLQDVSFDVAPGEIVGVCGITGSGREVLASLVFGHGRTSGVVRLGGRTVPPGRPDLSVSAGMGLVPADRQAKAVFPGHDVTENLTMVRAGDYSRHSLRRPAEERRATEEWIGRLDVRPPRPRAMLSDLSGGNAQKVILARWMRLEPRVLVLDEPTQGIDVGAKTQLHQRVREAAASGAAVLVCSSDSEELAHLCTRVIALVGGVVAAELLAPLSAETITSAAISETERNNS